MLPLKDLRYESYTGTNKTTETKIINDIKRALQEDVELSEDIF